METGVIPGIGGGLHRRRRAAFVRGGFKRGLRPAEVSAPVRLFCRWLLPASGEKDKREQDPARSHGTPAAQMPWMMDGHRVPLVRLGAWIRPASHRPLSKLPRMQNGERTVSFRGSVLTKERTMGQPSKSYMNMHP
jgi:hypothetical protein